MILNLAPAADALLAIASAAVTAAVPIVIPAILKRLHVANDADLSAKLVAACEAGAGAAYKFATAHEGGLSNVRVHDGALAIGLSYVLSQMPTVVAQLGLTPEHVEAMVSARLGALLATDPTVSAGLPTPAPTPAAQPAPAAPAA